MKKVTVIVGMMMIFGVFGPIFGNETYENENFKKAGQQALAAREAELKRLAQEINDYIHKIAEDGRATSREMLILERKVAQFDKKKKNADKDLKIYGLTTQIELKPEIRKLVSEYENHFVWKRDEKGEVRKLFACLTGRDLVIESRIDWILLVVLSATGLAAGFLFALVIRERSELEPPLWFLLVVCCFILITLCIGFCIS